ncbi:MAG: hypothetical protein MPJ24_07990, partial [Pirellulaceae bacterium]|nr:hypothetical protein [Pirellulaceae bacterium]
VQEVAKGADLVITRADTFIGGPECGLVFGKKMILDQLRERRFYPSIAPTSLTLQILEAILAIYWNDEKPTEKISILSLLSTPVENLKMRAEKIVLQLEFLPSIEVVEARPRVEKGDGLFQREESYGVAIVPKAHTAGQLLSQLATLEPPIKGVLENEGVYLDLSYIFPGQDRRLVESVASLLV